MFGRTGHGGGIIKRKLFLSVLLLFGLALVLNVNFASATNVTTDKAKPKVTSVNPVNNSVVLSDKSKKVTIKVNFNEKIKSGTGSVELSANGKSKPVTTTVNGNTLTITSKNALSTSTKYSLIIHSNTVTDSSGNGNQLLRYTFTVSPISKAQMKDGISRVQSFYNKNNRLPNTVSFGAKKITISEFQKIIATQGLKIYTVKSKAVSNSNVKTVTAYGWNSCSKGWYKTGGTWKDYCPFCHSYNCLTYNPKHTYEGEWTCSKCDADFCNCGRCKASGSQVYLVKA
ncbi:Pseudomurein-binding repeat-containing protein [Methanobacterium lacus]|uniref:Pseudomurein-binding repeat-containing protein n=1 Tax=Methanobacterium lacus (strain AL-21) TaxID=877455 RepID=F0T7K4_METLA|nr:Ig-like domain-containing protein [Methanobacterium lacus]ADZ09572.1 Pseudomurein-binding repeat-containing protein [Methanobacterium lacus]